MADETLARVIYSSHSLLPESPDQRMQVVTELLRIARQRNAETGLTGVLLFDGTRFLQAIEGETGAVETAFENIACDRRHEEIELLEFKPIPRRDYPNSPLAYIDGLSAEQDTLRDLLYTLRDRPTRDPVATVSEQGRGVAK